MTSEITIKTDCTKGLECHDSLTFVASRDPWGRSQIEEFPVALRVVVTDWIPDAEQRPPGCKCMQFFDIVPESARQTKDPRDNASVCACYGHLVE